MTTAAEPGLAKPAASALTVGAIYFEKEHVELLG